MVIKGIPQFQALSVEISG